jgi:catalase
MSESAPGTVVAQIVETMRALAGSHPGFRPVHAKGMVCSGTFRGAPQAHEVSRAPHLQGRAVPTVIRFANASGNPEVHDGLANTRSLAVKFQLPEGKSADVLANSIEGFPVRTPEDFLALLRRSFRTRSPASPHPMRSPASSTAARPPAPSSGA